MTLNDCSSIQRSDVICDYLLYEYDLFTYATGRIVGAGFGENTKWLLKARSLPYHYRHPYGQLKPALFDYPIPEGRF